MQAIQANINEKQAAIDNARAKEGVLTSDISALSKRIRTLTREIGSLRRREARVQNTLDARRAQLARVQARYQVEHERFVRLRRELRRSQGVLAERLIEIYKADQPDMLSVILESDGFNDLLVRADYMSAIGEQDSVIVDKVRALKKKSAQKRLLLVVLRSQAVEAVRVIEIKQRELQEARAAIQANEADLASARRYKFGKLGNVREHRHELEGDLRALQAASAQVTNQLQGAGPGARGADPPGRRRLHLAGERAGRVALRDALGPAARGRRHRGARRHADPGRGQRDRRDGGLDGRLRPVHLHPARRRRRHVLRAPVVDRRRHGSEREAGSGDRLGRLHRPLLRRPPALRGADQRVPVDPMGYL